MRGIGDRAHPAGKRWECGLLTLAAAVTAAAVLTAAASGAEAHDPRLAPTRGGMASARSVLLTAADVGTGWLSAEAHPTPGTSVCSGRLDAYESDLVETGTAAGFLIRGVSTLLQTSAVFATAPEGAAAWSRTVTAILPACMRTAMSRVQVTLMHARRLTLPDVGLDAAGFRVVGLTGVGGELVTMYFDQFLVHRGRTITRLFLTSFTRPYEVSFEDRLVRRLATRLGAGPVA